MLKSLAAITTLAMAACLSGCDGSSPGADNSLSAPTPLSAIRSLTCHLSTSVSAEIGPRIGKYQPIREGMVITFTDFDWPNHRARMIGNQGTAEVEARLGGPPTQMVFLERTLTGNTMMTSVFLTPIKYDANPQNEIVRGKQASVVHSRHTAGLSGWHLRDVFFGASDTPESPAVVSQMMGVCDIGV
jgi:hypothetical protein